MNSVERLRRLPAFATHRWLTTIRIFESFCRPEVFRAVIQVRRLVLLLVAHDAYPFPSPSKNIDRIARATLAHTDRATRSAFLSACSLSELHAETCVERPAIAQSEHISGLTPGKKMRKGESDA